MKLLPFLWQYYRSLMLLAAGVGLLGGAFNAALISLTNDNLSLVERGSTAPYGLYIALVVSALITNYLTQSLSILLSVKITFILRLSMSQQIMDTKLADLESVGAGRLFATFTDDIPAITQALLAIPMLVVNFAITVGCLLYLGFLSLFVFGVLFATLVFCLLTYALSERKAIKYIVRMRDSWDTMLAHFNAMNHGIKELKLHYARRHSFFKSAINDTGREVYNATVSQRNIYALLNSWVGMMYFLFVGVLLFLLPELRELDEKTIVGFVLVVLFARGPIMMLTDTLPIFRRADVAFGIVEKLGMSFTNNPGFFIESEQIMARIAEQPAMETVELKGVTHTYYREREASHFTLGPIDLRFHAGELIFFIGGNGSGKTTLAKLITGLYLPEKGEIHLNGKPVTEENYELYLQNYSAIFSDFYVFEDFLGQEMKGLDDRAWEYVRKLNLEHKVTIKDGKLSTTNLSSGQRKRLALLTVYLEDRPIYLFDEWAADQDPEFKEVFYRSLLPELKAKGKTVLVISHDDRYFDIADRIVKLVDGQLEVILNGS